MKITIEEHSSFTMGGASLGGAIYFKGPEDQKTLVRLLELSIKDTHFKYNKADISGGAIYMDSLDYYKINIDNCKFHANDVKVYGDNIYLR